MVLGGRVSKTLTWFDNGWGYAMREATSSVALYGIINTLARFAMPLIALIALAIAGELSTSGTAVKVITVISIAIFVAAVTPSAPSILMYP